jgi:uncharacterized protein YecA (UPF0149 family)
MPWFQQPFFQVALPIILTLIVAMWREDKRFGEFKESVNKQLEEIKSELKEIKELVRGHDRDITTLKERTGLVKVK